MIGPPPPLNIYAIIIGTNHYGTPSLDLRGASQDALRVARFLQHQLDPRAATLRELELLVDDLTEATPDEKKIAKSPTSQHVRDALRRLLRESRHLNRRDCIMIYMAGHGILANEDRELFLCCANIDPHDPEANSIRGSVLFRDMQDAAAETTFLVLDICYSGAMVARPIIDQNPIDRVRQVLAGWAPTPGVAHNLMIFAASNADQQAREIEYPTEGVQGVFTHTLLQGWSGAAGARDGIGRITPESLMGYIRLTTQGTRQVPTMTITNNDAIVFAYPPEHFQPPPTPSPLVIPKPAERLGIRIEQNPRLPTTDAVRGQRLGIPPAQRNKMLITLGAVVALAIVLSGLATISTFFFTIGLICITLTGLLSLVLVHEVGRPLAIILEIVQIVLLVGIVHAHYALAPGVGWLDWLASFGIFALVIWLFQTSWILLRMAYLTM